MMWTGISGLGSASYELKKNKLQINKELEDRNKHTYYRMSGNRGVSERLGGASPADTVTEPTPADGDDIDRPVVVNAWMTPHGGPTAKPSHVVDAGGGPTAKSSHVVDAGGDGYLALGHVGNDKYSGA